MACPRCLAAPAQHMPCRTCMYSCITHFTTPTPPQRDDLWPCCATAGNRQHAEWRRPNSAKKRGKSLATPRQHPIPHPCDACRTSTHTPDLTKALARAAYPVVRAPPRAHMCAPPRRRPHTPLRHMAASAGSTCLSCLLAPLGSSVHRSVAIE